MTATPSGLPAANEADVIEQAQAADGGLDDSSEQLDLPESDDAGTVRLDADQADVVEQAQTVKPARDEEYPADDD